jgi:hypothetical protein
MGKKPITRAIVAVFTLCAALSALASDPSPDPGGARFITEDIDRFWEAYDEALEAEAMPAKVRAFQELYIDRASLGLKAFVKSRVESAEALAQTVLARPEYYRSLRNHTPKAATAAQKTMKAFERLEEVTG